MTYAEIAREFADWEKDADKLASDAANFFREFQRAFEERLKSRNAVYFIEDEDAPTKEAAVSRVMKVTLGTWSALAVVRIRSGQDEPGEGRTFCAITKVSIAPGPGNSYDKFALGEQEPQTLDAPTSVGLIAVFERLEALILNAMKSKEFVTMVATAGRNGTFGIRVDEIDKQ